MNIPFTRLRQRIARSPLKTKGLLIYLISVFALVSLTIASTRLFVLNPVKEEYEENLRLMADKLAGDVNSNAEEYQSLLTQLSYSPKLYDILTDDYSDGYAHVWDAMNDLTSTYDVFQQYLPGTLFFRLYHDNQTLAEDGRMIHRIPLGMALPGLEENVGGLYEWKRISMGGERVLAVQCYVQAFAKKVRAYFLMGVNAQVAFGQQLHLDESAVERFYLCDPTGEIIASSLPEYVGQSVGKLFSTLPDERVSEQRGEFVTLRNCDNGWKLYLTMPMQGYDQKVRQLSMSILLSMVAISVVCSVLLFFYLNTLFRRLSSLAARMSAVNGVNVDQIRTHLRQDEITYLESEYNAMMGRLRDAVAEAADARAREKENALKVLEAQINPHFLYNTLGIIRWEAMGDRNQKVCSLIDHMTAFYRLSLNRGNMVLTVQKELEHIRAYIAIQQIRYRDIVQVEYRIDADVSAFFTLKMLLQPIVENSYLHGELTQQPNPRLIIGVEQRDKRLILWVEDNGIGMDEHTLACAQSNTRDAGIGLSYIRNILFLYYGHDAQLHIHSRVGWGTRVTISQPAAHIPPRLNETTQIH